MPIICFVDYDFEVSASEPAQWVGNPRLSSYHLDLDMFNPTHPEQDHIGIVFELLTDVVTITHVGIYVAHAHCGHLEFDLWNYGGNRVGETIVMDVSEPGVLTSLALEERITLWRGMNGGSRFAFTVTGSSCHNSSVRISYMCRLPVQWR